MGNEFIIYKITNQVNDKSYIGFTSKTLDQRWNQHVYSAIKRNSRYRLHAAIRKYGVENFQRSVLVSTMDGDHALNVLEPQFILEYNTQEAGYNTKPGGSNAGWKHSPETLQKMSLNNRWRGKKRSGELNPMFGRHHTPEAKLKVSEASRGNTRRQGTTQSVSTKEKIQKKALDRYANGFVNAQKGKPMREETKQKLALVQAGKVAWTKQFLVTFPDGHSETINNMAEFCRAKGLHRGNMSSVSKGTLPHHKGFKCSVLNRIEE